VILTNLPPGLGADVTRVSVIVALFFTYGFQMFPVLEIVDIYVSGKVGLRPLPAPNQSQSTHDPTLTARPALRSMSRLPSAPPLWRVHESPRRRGPST
jgi:hypothetical protein